jgi:hypothetical protein
MARYGALASAVDHRDINASLLECLNDRARLESDNSDLVRLPTGDVVDCRKFSA